MPKTKLNYFLGLKVIFKYLKHHKRDVFILIFLSVISSLSIAFLPYFFGRILDTIKSNEFINFFGQIIPRAIAIIIVWFLIKMVGDFADWRIGVKSEQLGAIIDGEYLVNGFGKLFELPMSFHKTKKIGEVAIKISRASEQLYNIITIVIVRLAPQFFSLFIGLIIVFYVKAVFGALLLLTIFIYSLILIWSSPKLTALQEQMNELYNRAYGSAYDAITNIQPIKHASAEKFEKHKLYKAYQLKAVSFFNRYIAIWQSFSQIQKILITLTQASIFLMSFVLINQNHLTIGQVIMLVSYGVIFFEPFLALGQDWQIIQSSLVVLQMSEKIVTLPSEFRGGRGSLLLDNVKGNVQYESVYFGYSDKKQILKGIDFEVKAGETVALVGESGVGKTTIIDLLSRFYEPSEGKILLDGHDIKKINLAFLRKQIAVVPQEVILFNDTVKNNIRYGNLKSTDEKLKKAAELAHADEFIEAFPKKYNQIVGERGVKLSVGQKQRLAIARAILRNPKILVLDEPTSALDAISEKYVTEALEELMKGRTTFIIAHRLSTVRKADKIIVLMGGKVVEVGKHDELIGKPDGAYRKLYEIQFGAKI